MTDVTRILSVIEQGDPQAAGELLPLVYDELRKLAAQRLAQVTPGQTLQATALVHEAYLRLVGGTQTQDGNGRRHFFAAAAEAMRRILIDRGRHKQTRSAALNQDISTAHGHPTGVVYNPTNDFVITNPATGVSAPATLIFDTIDGTISGWNPAVDPAQAILIRDTWAAGTPAVYTGLEIGQDSHGNNVLYVADFLNNRLEVINGSFTTISTTNCAGLGVSSDPYSWIWSAQAVNDRLYITFADLLNPAGGGGDAVDVFNTDGSFQYQLDANGPGLL